MKTYLKTILLVKLGILMHPKMTVLNKSYIIGRTFLMPPQEYGKISGYVLLKLLVTMKQI